MLDKAYFFDLIDCGAYEEARIYLEKFRIIANEDSFYYANMGWLFNHLEHYEEARIYLLRGIYFFPSEAFLYAQCGYSFSRSGKYEEACSYFLSSLRLGLDEIWIHLELAYCYESLSAWEKAINSYEDALLEDDLDAWILTKCGAAYEIVGKAELAKEYLRKAWRLAHDDVTGWELADFYNRQKDYKNEIAILLQLKCEEQEDDYERIFRLGFAYKHWGNHTCAQFIMEWLVTQNYKKAELHAELSVVYKKLDCEQLSMSNYLKALQCYEDRLISEERVVTKVYRDMIWLAHVHKDWERKLAYLKRMDECSPKKDCWMMYHFAKTYSELRQYDKAMRFCEYCIEHFDEDRDVFELYAWILGRNQKEERALCVLQRSIELFGDSEWIEEEMGWNCINLKLFTQAASCFLQAEALSSRKSFYRSLAGWSVYQAGDIHTALEYLLTAMEAGMQEAWIYVTIGEIYHDLQELEKAIVYFERAKELGFHEEEIDEEISAVKEEIEKAEERYSDVR